MIVKVKLLMVQEMLEGLTPHQTSMAVNLMLGEHEDMVNILSHMRMTVIECFLFTVLNKSVTVE